jgi:hypothetical protein
MNNNKYKGHGGSGQRADCWRACWLAGWLTADDEEEGGRKGEF